MPRICIISIRQVGRWRELRTGISGELVMEPGPVEVSAGSSSSDIRSTAKFNVTGKTRVIRGEDRAFLTEATVGGPEDRRRVA